MCEGIRIVFKVGLVLIGSVIGNTPERKACKSMYDTLHLLRNIPTKYMNERDFVAKVIALDLTEKDLQREHSIQANNRKVKKALEEKSRRQRIEQMNADKANGAANGASSKVAANGTSNGSSSKVTSTSNGGQVAASNGNGRNGTNSRRTSSQSSQQSTARRRSSGSKSKAN
jgi:hypothetical protein